MRRLLLLRHGEVEERYQRVFGGRIDMGLSANGQVQAQQLADHLRHAKLDALYVSPMQRAQQSAAPIIALNGHSPITLPTLREVDFGAWTGLRWEQVKEKFGISAFDWLAQLSAGGIAEAEPLPEFQGRIEQALTSVLATAGSGTVAVMCHGGVIRMMLAQLLGLPLPKMAGFEIDYASLTIVEYRPGKTEVRLLNFTPWRAPAAC